MKRIFISHPYRSNPKHNKEAVADIFLRLTSFGVMPISPLHMFSPLNDNDPVERELGLKFCEETIKTVDAVFFFGEWRESEGCRREFAAACKRHIPVYNVIGWHGYEPIFLSGAGPDWWTKERKKA